MRQTNRPFNVAAKISVAHSVTSCSASSKLIPMYSSKIYWAGIYPIAITYRKCDLLRKFQATFVYATLNRNKLTFLSCLSISLLAHLLSLPKTLYCPYNISKRFLYQVAVPRLCTMIIYILGNFNINKFLLPTWIFFITLLFF